LWGDYWLMMIFDTCLSHKSWFGISHILYLFGRFICKSYDWRCWWLLVLMFYGTIFKWCVGSSSHDLFFCCWWTTSTSFVNVIIINFFLGLLNRLYIKRSVYGTLLNKRSSFAIKHVNLLILIWVFLLIFH